jgi:hypothetical protein
MNRLKYLIPFLFLVSGCKQPDTGPKATFIIKGRVLNGTSGIPFANQQISAVVHVRTIGGDGASLGTAQTDANGNFSLSYKQTAITYDNASIRISSNFFILQNLPVNKNIDSIFYFSTLGKVKILLNSTSPLELNKDTLFINYLDYEGKINWDTISKTTNGLFKVVRVKTPYVNFWYGIGYKQIHQDPNYTNSVIGGKLIYKPIMGDPYIDSISINY